jgi:hypothetical protein
MAIQTSFPKIADQILSYNKNIIDILTKLNSLSTTTDPTVNVEVLNEKGQIQVFSLPSNNSLKADIERLNNNINSLYSIDSVGATIQTSSQNKFRKVITVDLNREPLSLGTINIVTKFKTSPNWFFDSLLDPLISVEFDLSNKIENNVRKCLSRRYIMDFAKDSKGNLTNLGQSAQNSFDNLFKGNSQIDINAFENWHKTTPGIVEPLNPRFDEQIFDLEPNSLLYDGEFNVDEVYEDKPNRRQWYYLNTLDYLVVDSNTVKQLAIGNEVIINSPQTSTRYKVLEVSTSDSRPRVRFERVEGIEPIPIGLGTLKIYSPVIYTKKLRVSVGYNERNSIFMKPINTDNNLLSRKWSQGTGFYTGELMLDSSGTSNGLSMDQFYQDYVYDYGEVLKDLVSKKTPNKLAGVPNSPTLNIADFKVVQINQHLTDTPDSNLIKQKHNLQLNVKSELEQIQNAIIDRNKKLKITKFKSIGDKQKHDLEVVELLGKREARSKHLSSLTKEIIDLSKNPTTKVDPIFRVRGFWAMPEAVSTRGTKPQEVVQFIVEYKKLSKDGKENPIETYTVGDNKTKASFSNLYTIKTDARKRSFDPSTGEYFWQIEDLESADTPNINQLDIPIQANEKVEIKVMSISEVGWPDTPTYSGWSETITIEFPDDLNNVLNEGDFILQEATKDDLRVSMNAELSAKGLDTHLEDQVIVDSRTFHHESSKIVSGFKDVNGATLDLFEYLKSLQDRIYSLEEKIQRAKGELEIVILRNNQEFIVSNSSETVFNVECEDYLDKYSATGAPSGRVYQNDIYVIKDFVIRIRNKSVNSPLGLLSGKTYLQNSPVYNQGVPQAFWVNEKDELMTSDISGSTKTQVNNQFLWQVNYDSISETTTTKLSENIGNAFTVNNSITSVLGSNEFSIGYNETSVLNFLGNNKSLLEPSKWIDNTVSVASTTKLLTSIHPIVPEIEKIVESNSEKVKTLNTGSNNDIIIPINIYFKMNSLDQNQSGLNYEYIDLNKTHKTVKHIKKIKFLLENEAENRPFTFSIKFNINRNKVILKKASAAINLQIK